MKVATLLFFGIATFLLGNIAMLAWTPYDVQLGLSSLSTGLPVPDQIVIYNDLVNLAIWGGSGLFIALATLQLLYEVFQAGRRRPKP